ncbi:L-type lectin-domain containing receptor kinase IX.1-like [Cynara cardunculus var. scolymus]|uniref:L-type lectin-domain containing receptor kinase IX.1-like n=1 Tax=Cynara cardunculus var. scolymus TaxID=59895 RepID=UPI000D62C296|nr:L-type lectin-domain containing receptor kinase IX.1-like [Cynara cardunculus var. scolymus]
MVYNYHYKNAGYNLIAGYFFLFLIPYVASLRFDLPNIGPANQNREIITEGDGAYISSSGIQVTPDEIGDRRRKARRARYFEPLHLWNNATGELASFATNFSFVIDSRSNGDYGDGLTFFLAENNSMIARGATMGLPIDQDTIVATNRFVAVEFDTYENNWDPRDSNNIYIGNHVGITISNLTGNSLTSVRSQGWFSNITGGATCQAWITYDSISKNLSVSFTGFRNNTTVHQDGLYYTIDLRDVLTERVIFGFSAATGASFQKNNVKSWSFSSSDIQNDEIGSLPPNPGPDPVGDKNSNVVDKNSNVVLIVGLSVAITFLAVAAFVLWRKKRKNKEDEVEELEFDVEMNKEFEMGTGPTRFFYHELAQSTSNFAENEKLGEGGFGGVYRGFLKDSRTYVAVKRVSKTSKQGIKEYASEVRIISRLRHRNLVQLIGWCHEKRELLLVYELMENGSLDSHLFKAKSLLTWGTRYKIAHGLASALLYLHEEWEQCVLHRDIKSSNVMLDSNFNPKLGDFGLAKLVDHEKDSQTTMLAGTLGYMAPECLVTGKASKESDVFSFGVVALEIACGRKPIEYKVQERQIRLVEWVWELYGTGTLLEAADPRLGLDFEEDEIKRLMIVGLWCVHPDSDFRPSMRQAIQVLNSEASLPILPLKMPVASYLPLPISSLYSVDSSSSIYNTDSSKQTTTSSTTSPSVSLLHSMQ